jgi:ABC-type Fe3+ transport system permease subunit
VSIHSSLASQKQSHRSGWRQFGQPGWTLLILAIALLLMTPILVVSSSIFADKGQVWNHLATTVLPRYIANSLGLMGGRSGQGCWASAQPG